MNEKTIELGLTNTHFVTPHGLDNEEHYTTAYELAIIADYALNIEKIATVVNTKNYTVHISGIAKNITNTNELLGYLDGVNGVKTGFTNKAGRCLVTSVSRNDFDIITVVLGADTKKIRTQDSIALINYVYANYELVNIKEIIERKFALWLEKNEIQVNKGKEKAVEVCLADYDYNWYPVKKNEPYNINIEIFCDNFLEAPVYKDYKVGKLVLKFNDIKIGEIEIKTNELVEKKRVEDYLLDILKIYKTLYLSN